MNIKKRFNFYYKSNLTPQKGDRVATPSFGECIVESLSPRSGLFTLRNIMTGEKAFQIISECDLIKRKQK